MCLVAFGNGTWKLRGQKFSGGTKLFRTAHFIMFVTTKLYCSGLASLFLLFVYMYCFLSQFCKAFRVLRGHGAQKSFDILKQL